MRSYRGPALVYCGGAAIGEVIANLNADAAVGQEVWYGALDTGSKGGDLHRFRRDVLRLRLPDGHEGTMQLTGLDLRGAAGVKGTGPAPF